MQKKRSNLGLNSGIPQSALTDKEAVALFHKNGRNHPLTRMSLAEKELSSQKNPAPKPSEPKKTG
jgi:hypothetical protein